MIDNTTIECEVKLFDGQIEGVFEYKDLLFRPVFNVFGQIKKYDSDVKGLRLNYYPHSERLYINNSLHKALHGNNYGDFTLSELKEIVTSISDTLSIDVFRGKLKRLEYGCNLPVKNAQAVYNSLLTYRGREYEPMISKVGKYGSICRKSQYELKGYDKCQQVKVVSGIMLPEEIFRWEVKIKNMQCIHKRKESIPITHVSDLTQPDKAQYLCNDLVNKYDQTAKGPVLDFKNLSLRKITAYARSVNRESKAIVRANHFATYQADRRIYNEIVKGNPQEDFGEMKKRLIDKCQHLLNG